MSIPILQRSRKDLVTVGVITAICAIAVGTVWATAPIRHSELSSANSTFSSAPPLIEPPTRITESWSTQFTPVNGLTRPVVSGGLVIVPTSNDSGTGSMLTAKDPSTNKEVWHYSRSVELCSLASGFNSAVVTATYRTELGCGDVVSIDASNGTYKATRSALNSDTVVPISSHSAVGTVSPDRMELWRSDLVRTVEYGHVEDAQEPDQQPHPDCTINSALTRTELLAVVERCPDTPGDFANLRLQKTTPEDSRNPEIERDVVLRSAKAQLIAIGQDSAAVYLPAKDKVKPQIISYNKKGEEVATAEVAASPLVDTMSDDAAFSPTIADLPHHMTWFDGSRLYLLDPSNLKITHVFEGALGTGVAVGGRLVFPVYNGLAVADWETGIVGNTLPVNRGGYIGPVSLNLAGTTLVEQRGNQLVAFELR